MLRFKSGSLYTQQLLSKTLNRVFAQCSKSSKPIQSLHKDPPSTKMDTIILLPNTLNCIYLNGRVQPPVSTCKDYSHFFAEKIERIFPF